MLTNIIVTEFSHTYYKEQQDCGNHTLDRSSKWHWNYSLWVCELIEHAWEIMWSIIIITMLSKIEPFFILCCLLFFQVCCSAVKTGVLGQPKKCYYRREAWVYIIIVNGRFDYIFEFVISILQHVGFLYTWMLNLIHVSGSVHCSHMEIIQQHSVSLVSCSYCVIMLS